MGSTIGIRLAGSLGPAVKASESLSFADIERAVTEAVKTMILTDQGELKGSDVAGEVRMVKSTLTKARNRAQEIKP